MLCQGSYHVPKEIRTYPRGADHTVRVCMRCECTIEEPVFLGTRDTYEEQFHGKDARFGDRIVSSK